jgi:hypothetical protein
MGRAKPGKSRIQSRGTSLGNPAATREETMKLAARHAHLPARGGRCM